MSAYDNNNIFAKILRREIPCDSVFENDYVLAFKDIAPQAPVHILVIPKGPYTDIADFGAKASLAETKAFFAAVDAIATDLGLHDEGYRCITNTGDHGGQEVPHFHLHLFGGEKMGAMREE